MDSTTGSSFASSFIDRLSGGQKSLKWVGLASFLSAITAVLAVALFGFLFIFILNMLFAPFLPMLDADFVRDDTGGPFFAGMRMAFLLSALNWFLFVVTLPAAWIALGLSIGRLPKKGVSAHKRYFFWACLWGAILVGATTTFFGFNIGAGRLAAYSLWSAFGAFFGGIMTGICAGAACALVFLTIVRPKQQIANLARDELEVFD